MVAGRGERHARQSDRRGPEGQKRGVSAGPERWKAGVAGRAGR